MNEFKDLFPDPDNDLADAAKKAGNIIFAQSFKPQPKNKEPVKQRSEVMDRRLKLLEEKKLFRKVNRDDYSTLFDFYDIVSAARLDSATTIETMAHDGFHITPLL